MRTELGQALVGKVNEVKHLLDFGPIAARRDKRAHYQLEHAEIGEFIVSGGTYLDIGCGKGYIRKSLEGLKPSVRVFGCDLYDRPTKRMRRLTSNTFTTSDGLNLPFPEASFNGVSLFFVLHHVPFEKHERLLKESMRVIRDDGYIFVAEDTVNFGDVKQWKVTNKADRKFNPDFGRKQPHDYRSAEDWKSMFAENGLLVVREISYQTGKVPHTFFVLN